MNRTNTYRRKIEYITNKLGSLPENLENSYIFDAVLYRLHTSIEALMDIIAMLVKDLGESVSDDYNNIEKIKDLGVIDEDLMVKLKKLNGLRKIIVHRYNKVDESIIKESLEEILDTIFRFVEIVENVLREVFK